MLLAFSAWISVLLIANYQVARAESTLKIWRAQQGIQNKDEWQEAYAHINNALKIDPANPDYLEKLAELYQWKIFLPGSTRQEREATISKALEYYQQLIKLKPSWPNYWSSLVQTKRALWDYDREMQLAIQNAAHYGPWFRNNQLVILRAGYQGWYFLDKETRKAVSDTLERAIKVQPKQTIQLALNSGFINRVMPYIENDKNLMQSYKREMANRKKKLSL